MKKIKILVLGSTGMLGHMVMKILGKEKAFTVHGTHLDDKKDPFYLDVVSSPEKLASIDSKNKGYNYFINCIGITKDKIDEKDAISVLRAVQVNTVFPYVLAEYASRIGARVIQISTDGVFSGKKKSYDEREPDDCIDLYGRTKYLGEVLADNFLNIRCSIIGPSPFEKRGLFEWFSSQPDGSKIYGYKNHIWNGVTTLQFAELCLKIIKGGSFDRLRRESHLFHFAPNRPVSKYELLILLKNALNKNINIVPSAHKDGSIRRVLVSRYKGIADILGNNIPMDKAVIELIKARQE